MIKTKISKIKLKGYTLVEVVLYLGLFAFIFTTLITFSLAISEFNRKDKYQVDLSKATLFIGEHMEESFKEAKSIDVINSIFDSNIGALSLTKFDNSTVKYRVVDNRIIFNNGSDKFISPDDLLINQFMFEQIIEDGSLVGVRLNLNISTGVGINVTKDITYIYVLQ